MDLSIKPGPFDGSMESLTQYTCPEWFRDAKFGIWSHWGPQSVPMFGDWYARHMFVEGSDQYRHHWRVYGHPSKHGYDEIAAGWKAEKFDPDALMGLFVDAGAKYFFGQAMHHDNFDNFDSAYQPFNSVNVGPKRDICRMWQEAAKAKKLPFGLSEHLGASYHWFQASKGADKTGPYAGVPYVGADPKNAHVYHPETDVDAYASSKVYKQWPEFWYTKNERFQRHWFDRIKDVIDKFQPDLLYSDGDIPFGAYGCSIIAHLYNTSIAINGSNQAIYFQKEDIPSIAAVGLLDVERGNIDGIPDLPWQCDTSVGDWFYNVKDKYKTPQEITETLVDIISKNGCLLLNVPQFPDGSLDDECCFLLKRLAVWSKANGHAVHGTRPWSKYGEGPTKTQSGVFQEKAAEWTSEDFRFTLSKDGNTVHAFQMKPDEPGSDVIIHSLADGQSRKVLGVRNGNTKIDFEQGSQGLTFKAPAMDESVGPVAYTISLI